MGSCMHGGGYWSGLVVGGNGKDNEIWSVLYSYSFLAGRWSASILYSYTPMLVHLKSPLDDLKFPTPNFYTNTYHNVSFGE